MVATTSFRANARVESEKCTLSALCALFDNRSAAGTPSLAALHLSRRSRATSESGDEASPTMKWRLTENGRSALDQNVGRHLAHVVCAGECEADAELLADDVEREGHSGF